LLSNEITQVKNTQRERSSGHRAYRYGILYYSDDGSSERSKCT